MTFDLAFAVTGLAEGKYSNNPKDRGGETMFGITVDVARANGYHGPMIQMPIGVAMQIAKSQYWDLLRLDEIDLLSPKIAAELFDSSYNCGTGQAGKWLQRSLNALNREGRDYADVNDDGLVGPKTILAFKEFMRIRGKEGESVLFKALNCLQGAYYIEISQSRPSNEDFVFGWISKRIS